MIRTPIVILTAYALENVRLMLHLGHQCERPGRPALHDPQLRLVHLDPAGGRPTRSWAPSTRRARSTTTPPSSFPTTTSVCCGDRRSSASPATCSRLARPRQAPAHPAARRRRHHPRQARCRGAPLGRRQPRHRRLRPLPRQGRRRPDRRRRARATSWRRATSWPSTSATLLSRSCTRPAGPPSPSICRSAATRWDTRRGPTPTCSPPAWASAHRPTRCIPTARTGGSRRSYQAPPNAAASPCGAPSCGAAAVTPRCCASTTSSGSTACGGSPTAWTPTRASTCAIRGPRCSP